MITGNTLSIPANTAISIEAAEFETTQGALTCDAHYSYDAANERVTMECAFIGAKRFDRTDMTVMVGAHQIADVEQSLAQQVFDNPSAFFSEAA